MQNEKIQEDRHTDKKTDRKTNMIYWGWGEISQEICNHKILWFGKISHENWIHEIFQCLVKSSTLRYWCCGVISHKNLQLWDILWSWIGVCVDVGVDVGDGFGVGACAGAG